MDNRTSFDEIYKIFLSKITEQMYLEISPQETESLLFELFQEAIQWFEFPRVDIYDFDTELQEYNIELSGEEINIIATYMVVSWLGQQLANVEITKMMYSGSD